MVSTSTQELEQGQEQEQPPTFLTGLVLKTEKDSAYVLSGSQLVLAQLPEGPQELPLIAGSWATMQMDLDTGKIQVLYEAEPPLKTYMLESGSFLVRSPATYYKNLPDMAATKKVAYTPFFRFVDDPNELLQHVDWMEWYSVLLAPSNGNYKLKVLRVLGYTVAPLELGAMPGMCPSYETITKVLEDHTPQNHYKGIREVKSNLLGLCIGHVKYIRTYNAVTGKFSAYGDSGTAFVAKGDYGGRSNFGGGGGRGGYNNNYAGGSSWRNARDRSDSDGDWRIAARREADQQPNQQHLRTGTANAKKVRSCLIATQRGMFMTKLEEEIYSEGDWLVFEKAKKSEMAAQREENNRDSYPPYILKRHLMPKGYNGLTRARGKGKFNVQVLVLAEYSCLRKKSWNEPSFFGRIECSEMMLRRATGRLEKEKEGWANMSEKQRDGVQLNVWVGMGRSEMLSLPGLEPFPNKFKWEVHELPSSGFLYDLPLEKARANLPLICDFDYDPNVLKE